MLNLFRFKFLVQTESVIWMMFFNFVQVDKAESYASVMQQAGISVDTEVT